MNFICHICSKEYSSYKSLWNHNNKFHLEQHLHINNNKERNFECEFCKKTFRTKQNMNIHIQKTCKYKIDKADLLEKQIVELQKEVNNLKSKNINTTNNGIINTNQDKNLIKHSRLYSITTKATLDLSINYHKIELLKK